MTTDLLRRSRSSTFIAVACTAIVLAGCAAQEAATAPASVEPKITNASSSVDHEELASWYESRAAVDAAAAKRHQGYAAIYRRNTSPSAAPDAHLALALRCENLARTYQQAAEQNLALAKMHRELAAQAK